MKVLSIIGEKCEARADFENIPLNVLRMEEASSRLMFSQSLATTYSFPTALYIILFSGLTHIMRP